MITDIEVKFSTGTKEYSWKGGTHLKESTGMYPSYEKLELYEKEIKAINEKMKLLLQSLIESK